MKLQNKKTGEIGYLYANKNENYNVLDADDKVLAVYPSLAALNEEWEDYEEPKKESNVYWYIGYKNLARTARTHSYSRFTDNQVSKERKEIGNYFETKEEAEKAVEKLKAWKRLKDKGFEFEGVKEMYLGRAASFRRDGSRYLHFNKSEDDEWLKENWDDIKLLFGGEE